MSISSAPNTPSFLPPESPEPYRRFSLFVPGQGNATVKLKEIKRVGRAEGWDFYLAFEDATSKDPPDLTPSEEIVRPKSPSITGSLLDEVDGPIVAEQLPRALDRLEIILKEFLEAMPEFEGGGAFVEQLGTEMAGVRDAAREMCRRAGLQAQLAERPTCRALQELKRHRAIMARLEVWIAARHRLTDAGESLAALNVHSKDRRADDAPEVLAYHAAERDLARAGDELYAAGTEADIYRKGASIAFEVSYDQVTRHQRALFKEQLFTFIYSRHTNQENVQALVKAVAEAMRSQLRKP